MLLSLLLGVINTLRFFPVAYYFVSSESAEVFIFINVCLQNLFFHNDCPGSTVNIEDFSVGLTIAMLQKQELSRSDADMKIIIKLEQKVNSVESEVRLQLCS